MFGRLFFEVDNSVFEKTPAQTRRVYNQIAKWSKTMPKNKIAQQWMKDNDIGFGGKGYQIRDVIHIYDVCKLIYKQIKLFPKKNNLLLNVGGGVKNAISLKELTKKCEKITSNSIKFSSKKSTSIYDIPYFVTDNFKVSNLYKWKPEKSVNDIIKDTHLWMKLNFNKLKTYIK